MREIVIVRRLFFLFIYVFFSFMLIATGQHVVPIIAVNGLNDTFWWHAHTSYGLSSKNWHLPPLELIIWKFAVQPMATSKSHNSGTVKDTRKMFAPNGVFMVGQSNGIIQIAVGPTLIAMATNWRHLDTKSAIRGDWSTVDTFSDLIEKMSFTQL